VAVGDQPLLPVLLLLLLPQLQVLLRRLRLLLLLLLLLLRQMLVMRSHAKRLHKLPDPSGRVITFHDAAADAPPLLRPLFLAFIHHSGASCGALAPLVGGYVL
jgi:hypothetical protein